MDSQEIKKNSRKGFWSYLKQMGPGMLVVGAFIGTGTITSVTVAGTNYGTKLLWAAVTVATILTIILQEMAARLALATGTPFATLIRERLGIWASILAIAAIAVGNTIYSVGNEIGVGLAMSSIFPGIPKVLWMFLATAIYWSILMLGKYRIYEKLITSVVAIMSATFLIDLIAVKPNVPETVKGLVIPTIPEGSIMVILALIGTTVVPYNLFLQSAGVIERGWHKNPKGNLSLIRFDTIVPIIIGGIITGAVSIVAATVLHPLHISQGLVIKGAGDMAISLKPLLGKSAFTLFSIGLFGSAVSSMPMAALSAAYVVAQSLNWPSDLKDKRFRLVFSLVAWIPVFVAAFATRPIWTIIFAQSVNGILLPIAAGFLIYLINKKDVAGDFCNNTFQNIIGGTAVAFAVWLGIKMLFSAMGIL